MASALEEGRLFEFLLGLEVPMSSLLLAFAPCDFWMLFPIGMNYEPTLILT